MWIAGSQMAEIDHSVLDAQTGGDADLAREVLGLFAEQCRRLLPPLVDPASPAAARADAAHTLKGSAAGIGALKVQALAGTAEAQLRADAPEAAGTVEALAGAIAAALAEIAPAV
jgi:HPt (histidine-containing phosphotransfer) domain-containing protein